MSEIYRWTLKSGPVDVRWEKVERIKRILIGGTYPVAPKRVAAKLLEQMLERGRANQRRERSESGVNSDDSSGVGTATITGKSETNDLKPDARGRARQTSVRGKVIWRGTFGAYEVTGWRYVEDATWHVKVWPVGRPSSWIGYTVRAGIFELKMVAQAHKEAVLHVIGEWEAELVET